MPFGFVYVTQEARREARQLTFIHWCGACLLPRPLASEVPNSVIRMMSFDDVVPIAFPQTTTKKIVLYPAQSSVGCFTWYFQRMTGVVSYF